MENTKRTVVMKFDTAIALLKEYAEFMESEPDKVAQIEASVAEMEDRKEKAIKKNSGEKKPTTASVENPKIANALYEALEDEVGYTATQISLMGVEGIASASKATTILRILLEDGRVTNKKVKGASIYYKA
jgi:hypothetical protein